MDEDLSIYCDESGNSGGNLADLTQPFYVLAGWQVQKKDLGAASIIQEFVESLDAENPKGGKLFNSKKAGETANMLHRLMLAGMMPTYHISEKRFVICAKLVETLMDPLFHDFLPKGFSGNWQLKNNYASQIYLMPDELLYAFGTAYFQKDIEGIQVNAEGIAGEIEGIEPDAAKAIRGGLAHVQRQFDYVDDQKSLRESKKDDAINVSALIAFLNSANMRARGYGSKFAIVHDGIETFEETYKKFLDAFLQERSSLDIHIAPERVLATHFDHIHTIAFKYEQSEPWLMGADFLASGLNFVLKLVKEENPIPTEIAPVFAHIFGIMLMEGFHGDGVMSDKFRSKLINKVVFDHMKTRKS